MITVYLFLLRVRCLGLFHDFEACDSVWPYDMSPKWYCRRCWTEEREDTFVACGLWGRILWRVNYRVWLWWYSWAWRFER